MVINDKVLVMVSEERSMWSRKKKSRNEWTGHILRHGGSPGWPTEKKTTEEDRDYNIIL